MEKQLKKENGQLVQLVQLVQLKKPEMMGVEWEREKQRYSRAKSKIGECRIWRC